MSSPPARESSLIDGHTPVSDKTVELHQLTKHFPTNRTWADTVRHPFKRDHAIAVDGVTFAVGRGEFFGLLGPNGAGKTTLFKMLATLVLPDAGAATVLGHDVVREAAAVNQVLTPVIADERSLYWRLSAKENLKLFAALNGIPRTETAGRVAELLDGHTPAVDPKVAEQVRRWATKKAERSQAGP